ncbi:methyltransferase domain-containing protein [Coraliomargarita parva]|uniref:methyltransferase domain-containing protein n=1 Tax=Coraliomargarita parva TaxID=3014050 RepID=UPI0022B595B6|nr:methyltransferase domain-containing protein [Coraliomargarita parva]
MLRESEQKEVSDIESRRVSFPGREGALIVGYLDEGAESVWNGRFIILTPKYGETKKNNLRLSYFLVANGFKVLRFDHTRHVGESEGEMSLFSLPSAVYDIVDAVNYVENHFEPEEIILVSNSLSARCGYRAVAREARISRLVSVVGVVNLRKTIQNIYQKDIIGTYCEGQRWGVIDILGFDIDSANFINRLVEENMHDLEGTLEDARRIGKPVLHLHASKDIWVDLVEVEQVVSLAGGELVFVDGAYHEIGENPEASRTTMEQVTRFCLQGLAAESQTLRIPCKRRLLKQNQKERNRLRQIYVVKETEGEFWDGYLGKFGTIEQANVYIEYFEKVQTLLGTVREGDVMLDAGCGNGFFGLCLLHSVRSAIESKSDFARCFAYFGIDLTPGGIEMAYTRQSRSRHASLRQSFDAYSGITLAYQRMDFDKLTDGAAASAREGGRFPFAAGSVAKICSSLVISYLKDPVTLLREFYRMLAPGGVAVVSSMKPDCDMTVLYHEFITLDEGSQGNADSAQELLGAAGRIKLKEQSGIYGFFSEAELTELALAAGFKQYDHFRSLGGQANIIRLFK